MKQLLIITALLAGITTVQAQSGAASHGQWEENDNSHHKTIAAPANEFVNMEMSVNDKSISFSGIPEVKRPLCAVITNGEGEYIKQAKLTPEQNVIDIKKLRGGLYFVTIVYRNQSKKAFTLNL